MNRATGYSRLAKNVGVNTALIRRTSDQPTSYTDVMTVASTGRRTFFHQRGANTLFDVDSIRLGASDAKIFHLGYLLLLDKLDQPGADFGTRAAELLDTASKLGFITSVDVVSEESDRFTRVVLPTLPFLDIIFLNEFEAWLSRPAPISRSNADGPASANDNSLSAWPATARAQKTGTRPQEIRTGCRLQTRLLANLRESPDKRKARPRQQRGRELSVRSSAARIAVVGIKIPPSGNRHGCIETHRTAARDSGKTVRE